MLSAINPKDQNSYGKENPDILQMLLQSHTCMIDVCMCKVYKVALVP